MRIAIFESITTPGGHEVDFDRILVEELKALGHEVVFCVPEDFSFPIDHQVTVIRLKGTGVSYTGLRGAKKLWASVKREQRRQQWYRELYTLTHKNAFDAVIVPTSTYRYLRAIRISPLKNSPIPICFILHGINPQEAPKFLTAARGLAKFSTIRMAVLTFGNTVLGHSLSNVHCLTPPTYMPRDIEQAPMQPLNGRPLKLGFFGQYRREKQLDVFLEAFLARDYRYPVELIVQGATMRPEDSEDFERIIKKYKDNQRVRFLHKGLWGRDWQEAIQAVDALLMPYGAERYRYHWAGMLFTAIGYQKPVVASREINPEVFEQYRIGMTFDSTQPGALADTLTAFIDSYPEREELYLREMKRAWMDYHPRAFAERIAELCRNKQESN